MKKSFRLLIGILVLGGMVSATSVFKNVPCSAGVDPVPICPPIGCDVTK